MDEVEKAEEWGNYQTGLRILMNPLFGSSSMLESSPSFHRLCDMVEWMQENCDFPHYWHVLWPTYDDDEIRYRHKFANNDAMARIHNYDNVELIRSKFHATQMVDMNMCTRELRETINMGEGRRFYDVIWNDKPPATNTIMDNVGMSRSHDKVLPPIINEMQIVPRSGKSFSEYAKLRHILAQAGPSTHTLYERPAQKKLMSKVMKQYLKTTKVREIQKQSSSQPPGLNVERLDEVINEVETQTDPVLINYGSKIYEQRNYQEAWTIVDKVLASGANAEMQIVTPNMSPWARNTALEYSDNIEHFNVYQNLTKDEYLHQSGKAAIMVDAMEAHYEFNLTLAEVAYMGALPVVRNSNWSRHMYPDDYPFRYNDPEQGVKMLIYAINNIEELQEEWVPKFREHFRENLSFEKYVREKLRLWDELRQEHTLNEEFYDLPEYGDHMANQERKGGGARDRAIIKCLKRMDDQFTMEDFADVYEEISSNDVKLLDPLDGRKPAEHVRYYWALKNNGVVDKCDGPDPLLDKTECDLI